MAPLEIQVNGTSTLHHAAERGYLFFDISATLPSQEAVSTLVTTTSNTLLQNLQTLSPKDPSGAAHPTAPITKYTIGLLKSWSQIPPPPPPPPSHHTHSSSTPSPPPPPLPRQYSAKISISAIFRDFAVLGTLTSTLFATPHVQITRIEWRLTEPTTEELVSRSRKEALRDAVRRANDYAEIVGRNVVAVRISEGGFSTGPRTVQFARHSVQPVVGGPAGLALEPEDVEVKASVEVKFAAE